MVELIGDPCIPSTLIIPQVTGVAGDQPTASGALFISGAKLFFSIEGSSKIITSA